MGEVYRATHTRLGRSAAVKVIRPEALDVEPSARERALTRFEVEARATAALTSPHTVQVFDFGRTADGGFFYAMELLEGMNLEQLVEVEGPLEPARAVYLLRQVCESLGEAHARGLVHRDIKPSNVFVAHRGLRGDFVKVLDFGLVKQLGGDGEGPHLTPDDTVVGTPAFVAPEAIRGHDVVDARSDVYSLGCVAVWMLTGELVFDHERVYRMILAHLEEAPAAPSLRTERSIPPGLDALVLRCLRKDPSERPGSAEALSAALADCGVEPAWTDDDAERWWRMHHGEPHARITIPGPTPHPPRPPSILVVDDDSAVRLVLTKLLRQVGYDARSVASGPEALRAIDARAIDLVVTDLAMPTMSGIQLAAELVERCPGLPVIVLTAHGNVPTAVEAMRAGARDFLMKPFDRDQVCRVVEAALGRGGRGG